MRFTPLIATESAWQAHGGDHWLRHSRKLADFSPEGGASRPPWSDTRGLSVTAEALCSLHIADPVGDDFP